MAIVKGPIMVDVTKASYIIRTKAGDKGPFTCEQIKKLVRKGQLPESVSVRDVDSGKSIPVTDILTDVQVQAEFADAACQIASELTEDEDPFGDADATSDSTAETISLQYRIVLEGLRYACKHY